MNLAVQTDALRGFCSWLFDWPESSPQDGASLLFNVTWDGEITDNGIRRKIRFGRGEVAA